MATTSTTATAQASSVTKLPLAAAIIASAREAILSFFATALLSPLPAPRYSGRGMAGEGRWDAAADQALCGQRRAAQEALQAILWVGSSQKPGPSGLTFNECCSMLDSPPHAIRKRVVAEFRSGPPQHLRYLRELCR